MLKIKFFTIGFISCLVPVLAISYVIFINITHSLLVSKINTEVSFVEAATSPDGLEKLRSVISINLVNDYCDAKRLGESVVTKHNMQDSQVYEKVKKYMEKYELENSCLD